MTTPPLAYLSLALALGTPLLQAQQPGDPDYEPDPETAQEYESLGEEHGSDHELEEGTFDEAANQAAANAPEVTSPGAAGVERFRAGLKAHWGGNLPALWAYLNRIGPAGEGNPEPPSEGAVPLWEPNDDYDRFGNLIESAEEKRERWRRRVERKLARLA